MKSLVNKVLGKLGFKITKISKVTISLSGYEKYPQESLLAKKFYNIGSGLFYHPYWTNIDYGTEHYSPSQKHPFINYDLTKLEPLPIEDSSGEIVYSSHTIEHVNDDAVRNMLAESYRILKPGGCIRLTAPNLELDYRAFLNRDIHFWYWRDNYSRSGKWEHIYKRSLGEASVEQLFLLHFAGQLSTFSLDNSPEKKFSDEEISEVFAKYSMEEGMAYFAKQCKFNPDFPGNHMNFWTHNKVISFLQEAGFSNIYISGFGQSQFAPLRDTSLFDNTHPKVSLYVEAIKS
ncbi:MAG: methyltransferase domain-containing protein [Candidatus Thorarchaeota archaeon]